MHLSSCKNNAFFHFPPNRFTLSCVNTFSCLSSPLIAVSVRDFIMVVEPLKFQSPSSTMFHFSSFYSSMWPSLLPVIRQISTKCLLLFILFPPKILTVLQAPCLICKIPRIKCHGIVCFWQICLNLEFSVVLNESRIVANQS